jgi:hypothetical protein
LSGLSSWEYSLSMICRQASHSSLECIRALPFALDGEGAINSGIDGLAFPPIILFFCLFGSNALYTVVMLIREHGTFSTSGINALSLGNLRTDVAEKLYQWRTRFSREVLLIETLDPIGESSTCSLLANRKVPCISSAIGGWAIRMPQIILMAFFYLLYWPSQKHRAYPKGPCMVKANWLCISSPSKMIYVS